MSWASGQRGWKGQPGGMAVRLGGRPLIAYSHAALAVQPWDGVQQSAGVRVGGRPVELVDGGGLDDPAGVHHRDRVGDVRDHAQVMGDQDQPHGQLALELGQQIHHLRLHGDVQRRGRLVRDDQVRAEGQCHRDHDALAHPAGELVRIVAHPLPGRGDADPLHQLHRSATGVLTGHPLVDLEHLPELGADAEDRVQRGQRVLEDHRHLRAADPAPVVLAQGEQIAPLEDDLAAGDEPRRRVEDAHHGLGGDGLAGARLTEHRQRLTGRHAVADAVDGLGHAVPGTELDPQVPHVEQGRTGARGPCVLVRHLPAPQRSLGSRASRTASPSKMNASTVMLSAPAGHSSMCGALRM